MESTHANILDQEFSIQQVSRRKIQPWWMKTFSWIFMVFAAFLPVVYVMSFIFKANNELSLYGIKTTEPQSLAGITISLMFLLKGVTGFGLWFEKDWAITAGLVDVGIGIIVCICVMFVFPLTGTLGAQNYNFRLEILFVGLFLYGLLKVRRQWW